MQAVILVGGEGTRLRPLTSTVPKPVVPLVDRPFIAFMLEWLARHGVDDVVMSCGFLATARAQRAGRRLAVRAAPALRRGARAARDGRGAQVRRGPPRRALPDAQRRRADRHRPHRADRPARGDRRGRHARARSGRRPHRLRPRAPARRPARSRSSSRSPAPTRSTRSSISAGAYVLERAVLDLIPADRNVSIEREVWPQLVGKGLFGYAAEAYWLDIGTPERYLQGTFDILEGNVATAVAERLGRRLPGRGRARAGRRAHRAAGAGRPRLHDRGRRARRLARRPRRGRDGRGGDHDRALGGPQRRRDRRGLRAARLHRRRRRAHRRQVGDLAAARSSARA